MDRAKAKSGASWKRQRLPFATSISGPALALGHWS